MQTVKHISTHPNVAPDLAKRDSGLFLNVCAGVIEADFFAGRISLDQYRREIGELEQLERKGEAA